jgi:hypothetical protein
MYSFCGSRAIGSYQGGTRAISPQVAVCTHCAINLVIGLHICPYQHLLPLRGTDGSLSDITCRRHAQTWFPMRIDEP